MSAADVAPLSAADVPYEYNWVCTIGAGEMQSDDISLISIERMGTAIDDLGSLGVVRADR